MRLNSFPRFLAFVFIVVTIAALISSCYSPHKAEKQTSKALDTYPKVAAELIRKTFPCVTTSVDSTAYLDSIGKLKEALNKSRVKESVSEERIRKVRDSLLASIQNEGDIIFNDCDDISRKLVEKISRLQVNLETSKREVDKKEAAIDDLERRLSTIPPIEKGVADMADVYLANARADSLQGLYNIDHAWRAEREAKDKGKILIRIPEWIIYLLLIVAGLSIVSRIWKKSFNPLSLLFK